jgi:glutathione S-transferase
MLCASTMIPLVLPGDKTAVQMKRKTPEAVGACFDLIERDMLKGPWVMGKTYTICDPYLITVAE